MAPRFALVLAGGVGARLWPRSRRARPKQCLALDGERSLLQQTLDRLDGLVPRDRVLVVTGRDMADAVRGQLPDLGDRLLVEPSGRGTAPPIVWGAAEVARRGGESFAVLPSDHRVADPAAFRRVLEAALTVADAGALVLLGVRPTRPETGFGWIVPGPAERIVDGLPIHGVARFTEKPDRATAERLLADGALWNGGMFCWRVDALARALRSTLPGAARGLRQLLDGAPVEAVWGGLEAVSIDRGVLERASGLAVVPCAVGWSDLGAWDAVGELLPAHALGRARVAAGLALDGGDHVVHAPDKLVVTVGVERLVIVDAGDALLVCRRQDAQQIGRVVAELGARGLDRWT